MKKKPETRTDYVVSVEIGCRTIEWAYTTIISAKRWAKQEEVPGRTVKIWKRTWEVV